MSSSARYRRTFACGQNCSLPEQRSDASRNAYPREILRVLESAVLSLKTMKIALAHVRLCKAAWATRFVSGRMCPDWWQSRHSRLARTLRGDFTERLADW